MTLLAEFAEPSALLLAARQTRQASLYRVVDAYTPFSVEGLASEIEGMKPTRLPSIMALGGLAGAAGGLFLQWISAVRLLPVMAGGRAQASWPDFAFATFELGILGAALCGIAALLAGCGLPRLHHPLFGIEGFERATQDRFFLEVDAGSAGEAVGARAYLKAIGALSVHEVPR